MGSEQMSYSHEDEDRLSNLPEDVLSHILSLMPTNFAVGTSILSKKWRYNWTLLTSLDFIFYGMYPGYDTLNCQFSNFLDRLFEHYKTSQLKVFRLNYVLSSVQKSNVSNWINEAVRLNVCELDVKAPLIKPHLSLFTCKTLTKLRLDELEDFIVPSVVILPRLKTLDITVTRKASVNASRLIRGCPMLESFVLVKGFCNEEEDYNFNIPTLKRLTLITSGHIPWCCESSINKVVLNVPNLEYIWVGGGLRSLFVIENLSSLVVATVSLSYYLETYLQVELLKGISGAKSLSWSSQTLNVVLKSPLPKFPNLKHFELSGPLQSRSLLLFQHLGHSSELEHLCFQEPEESSWIEPQSVPTWMLTNLKTMEITKYKGRKCSVQLIEYMLSNSEVLKTLTIKCESLHMEDEMRLRAHLWAFPKASRYCQIHFFGKWLSDIF